MNLLDQTKPGEKSAKLFRRRVDQKRKKGVPIYESGSRYGEPMTGTPSPVIGQKRKRSKVTMQMTAEDFEALSDDDQDDFKEPGQAKPEAREAPAAYQQNESKLLSRGQAD